MKPFKVNFFFLLLVFLVFFSFQNTLFAQERDSLHNKNRKILVTSAQTTLAAGSLFLLNNVWYSDFPKSDFHLYNDGQNWLQMDKVGHSFAAYSLNRMCFESWKWSGVSEKKSLLYSSIISWSYLLGVEILDGKSSEWGFSPGDLIANSTGNALFISQHLLWKEQRFQLKYGYFKSGFAQLRPETLGANFSERLLKDYNAQSYWLSFSPKSFLPNSKIPSWLEISLGYSANAKLFGKENEAIFDGKNYSAQREFALSLDINWKAIPTKNKALKTLFTCLNAVKVPFPSLFFQGKNPRFGFI